MNEIFLGEPPANIKSWIIEHYTPAADSDTHFTVQTTSSYKKSGIYSAQRDDTTKPVVIDWGDGTVEQVNGDINQQVHTYASVGEFTVNVQNIKTFAASTNNSTWYNTTSQNRYTLKEVVLGSSMTSIGMKAFLECTSLTEIIIESEDIFINEAAFDTNGDPVELTMLLEISAVEDMGFEEWYLPSGSIIHCIDSDIEIE